MPVIIALAALVLISLLAVIGLGVLAAALYLWMTSGQNARGQSQASIPPPADPAFLNAPPEDPATEVFNRSHMFAVFDSDDMDATEVVRMEGGILLDGRTDPALVRTHSPSGKADKD